MEKRLVSFFPRRQREKLPKDENVAKTVKKIFRARKFIFKSGKKDESGVISKYRKYTVRGICPRLDLLKDFCPAVFFQWNALF